MKISCPWPDDCITAEKGLTLLVS